MTGRLVVEDPDVRLWQGEALRVLRSLPDASVDAVITDPPYSSGGQFRGDRTSSTVAKYVQTGTEKTVLPFSGDTRDQRGYAYWSALWLAECLRIAKPGAPICLFTDWRQLPTTTDALQAGGWVWRGIVVWDKTEGARPVPGRFRAQAEFVVWGSNGPLPIERRVGTLPGVFRAVVRQAEKHHIAGKPTSLMRELVRICEPGGIVLDPFLGSGSTGVAALAEGRRCWGIEVEPVWIAMARERLAAGLRGLFADDVEGGA